MTCLHNIRYKKLYDNKVFPLGSTEKLLSPTQNDTFSNPRRYAFLLKDARNYWKMFECEEDKKKKVYPACPICWARRIHLIIYILYDASLEDAYASFFLKTYCITFFPSLMTIP